MKIQIECDEHTKETQVVIRCGELNEQVKQIQQVLAKLAIDVLFFTRGIPNTICLWRMCCFLKRMEKPFRCTQETISIRPDTNCMSWRNFCPEIL